MLILRLSIVSAGVNKYDLAPFRLAAPFFPLYLLLCPLLAVQTSALDASGVDSAFQRILTEIYRLMSRKTIAANNATGPNLSQARSRAFLFVFVFVDVVLCCDCYCAMLWCAVHVCRGCMRAWRVAPNRRWRFESRMVEEPAPFWRLGVNCSC